MTGEPPLRVSALRVSRSLAHSREEPQPDVLGERRWKIKSNKNCVGWRDRNDQLWIPNTIARVSCPTLKIHEDWLIGDCD
jgi:hypothetical protein